MKNGRAYGQMVLKAISADKREFVGIASTITSDRVNDVMIPEGAKFQLPIPFLWHHDHRQPIGEIYEAKITKGGIEVKGRIAQVDAPSQLAARLEEAWQSIKTGLVKGLSIGFRPIEYAFLDDGGMRVDVWDWFELSAVTVAANQEASITQIKSADQALLAAIGKENVKAVDKKPSGASEKKIKIVKLISEKEKTMTLKQQLEQFQKTLAAKQAEAVEFLKKSADATLNAEDQEAFDTLTEEVEEIEGHIARVEKAIKFDLTTATAVDEKAGATSKAASAVRAPAVVKNVREEEPGIGFAKFALAMHAGKGNVLAAKSFADEKFGNDSRLQAYMKAAVAAGTTTGTTWAAPLVRADNLGTEFLEYLRPRTIIGQFGQNGLPSLRRIPFNVRIPGKTAAGVANWVGEGYAKPVTSSGYAATEHKWAKIAAISVITEELDRFSDPAIQALVRDDLAEAVIERADIDFINPDKAAGTGATASPASITNGVTPISATADPLCDIPALWAVADSTNLPASSAVYITDSRTARALSQFKNALGQKEFPNVTMTGGSIDGVPLIISNYVPSDSTGSLFILAFASEISLSDDGQVSLDVSREVSILMDSAPNMNSGTPTAAQLVSMFQTNSLAIRAERYINWSRRRPQAVAFLEGVNWTVCEPEVVS